MGPRRVGRPARGPRSDARGRPDARRGPIPRQGPPPRRGPVDVAGVPRAPGTTGSPTPKNRRRAHWLRTRATRDPEAVSRHPARPHARPEARSVHERPRAKPAEPDHARESQQIQEGSGGLYTLTMRATTPRADERAALTTRGRPQPRDIVQVTPVTQGRPGVRRSRKSSTSLRKHRVQDFWGSFRSLAHMCA